MYDPNVPNHRYSAPNKFYEALALGKPIVVAKGTGIDVEVERLGVGIAETFSAQGLEHGLAAVASSNELRSQSAELGPPIPALLLLGGNGAQVDDCIRGTDARRVTRLRYATGLLASTGLSAIGALLLQGSALLLLTPSEYGKFSLGYASFVFFLSGAQSIVVDVWLREHAPTSKAEFVGAAAGFALVASSLILVFVWAIDYPAWLAGAFAVAAGAACLRMCLRAHSTVSAVWLSVAG